jgi:hypothetical protein
LSYFSFAYVINVASLFIHVFVWFMTIICHSLLCFHQSPNGTYLQTVLGDFMVLLLFKHDTKGLNR